MPYATAPSAAALPPATRADPPSAPDRSEAGRGPGAWQDSEFSFSDLLDFINPLQHIPIVNKIYREITGDEIGVAARVGGSTLFGGVIGLVASLVDTALESTTGKDTFDTVVAALRSGESDAAPEDQGTDVAEILGYRGQPDVAALPAGDVAPRQFAALADDDADDAAELPAPSRSAPMPSAAAAQTAPMPVAARAAPAPRTIEAAAPRPLQTNVPLRGVRGLATPSLPSPRALAANPELLDRVRTGALSQTLGPQMMGAAGGGQPTGPQGLASATIARAMAGYGAASALAPVPRR